MDEFITELRKQYILDILNSTPEELKAIDEFIESLEEVNDNESD